MIKSEKERLATEMSYDKYNFRYDTKDYKVIFNRGLNEDVVKEISRIKQEPEWMTEFRLKGLKAFQEKPMPQWGANLNEINFDNIIYYMKPSDSKKTWEEVPMFIKETFDRLGIPEAERKFLAGVSSQFDSEVIYHSVKKELEEKGVIFLSMDEGLKQYSELVKKYFGTVIPFDDNKFAALNTSVWSGGSFVYIPKNIKVDMPLQAYFRINAADIGQFERTLIVLDEGSQCTYVEGCSAPRYSSESLHSAVVEIIALPGSKVQYVTLQNWASNIYNLVTKRSHAYKDASVYWIDCNLGSKVTMKYPSIYLLEEGARGEVLSVAFAGKGQHQDAGAKIIHVAPNTTSTITSKSISKSNGRATYRGLLKVYPDAKNIKSSVKCDALLIDKESRTDTYPTIEIDEPTATVTHEATVGKIGEDQIFYLTSRGLSEEEATTLIVLGFVQPFTRLLPMEYAVEFNRLIELEMEGSVG
ncbi:MAG: Fe-S cluster assembly protein SufB [Nanoarchaeota archaeon]